MNLSPMRYKNFIWPHNPRVYSITYERKMAVNKIPRGRHHLQSLGQTRRVFRGEGEFVGAGAYDTFKALANVFYEESAGPLVHPVWMAANAWFVGLKLEQEPRSDYVRYSFEFWEVMPGISTGLTVRKTEPSAELRKEKGWYTVGQKENLWAIAQRHDTTVEELMALNPSIRNPNLVVAGQRVRVSL